MPPVRRRIEQHVGRPSFDAALKHGLQRFVGRVHRFEGKVVAEQDEAMLVRGTQVRKEMRKRSDVFAMNLDELEALHFAMHRLDQRALAHAACAHSSALLAGSPRAKRSVLVSRGSRMRSMPLSSERCTRL